MHIGLLKETKPQEYRVPLTPESVKRLTEKGHEVVVQKTAGAGAGFPDELYESAGARILDGAVAVSEASDLLVKVKEPIESDFGIFRAGQSLFSFLHSETRPALVDMLLDRRIIAVAFENIVLDDGTAPLLAPMSILAGQHGVLQGMMYLCNHKGGAGRSLVAFPGLEPARVVVFGAGQAGYSAAGVAASLGAEVHLFEIDRKRIRSIAPLLPKNIQPLHIDGVDIAPYIREADMVVNTATIPPDSDRHLIDRGMLSQMKKGAVIVDVTANLRGAIETVDRYTTHQDPVWEVDGIIHYAVTNIPSSVANTASHALSMEVLPFLTEMADKGPINAIKENPALMRGLTAVNSILTWHEAGTFLERPWQTPEEAIRACI